MSDMQINTVQLHLPVTISRKAQRAALLATGHEPEAAQTYRIYDFSDVEPAFRERLVEIRDRCGFDQGASYIEPEYGLEVEGDDWQVTSFEWVHRDRTTGEITVYQPEGATPGEEPPSVTSSRILFPGEDGRTRDLIAHAMDVSSAPDVLEAALAGAPLVSELENDRLTLDVVLSAYEHALKVVGALARLAGEGEDATGGGLMWTDIEVRAKTLLITARRGEGRTVGLHRDSDPETFDTIKPLVAKFAGVGHPGADEFRDRVTHYADRAWTRMSDAERVSMWIKPSAAAVEREASDRAKAVKRAEAYKAATAAWIEKHGSSRLKKAASRGYKHDRLYRDERLAAELPEFFAAKVKKVGEPLAPTEEALDLEAEVEELITGTSMKCKLVWVVFDDEHAAGVHVQVEGFLGRHTVYRRPEGDYDDEEPF